VTVPPVTAKAADVAPAATVTLAGMLTAALFVATDMAAPAAGAALVNVMVQVADPPLRIVDGVQLRLEMCVGATSASDADCEEPL
jgi:hypothetical protein